ncbi:uncharacterized protein [Antedon mediterranea]|uniref:uncharacterized protein n=1 Tax=Antedon mediterranea TaxID=105859 RepID=UPI003AF8E662
MDMKGYIVIAFCCVIAYFHVHGEVCELTDIIIKPPPSKPAYKKIYHGDDTSVVTHNCGPPTMPDVRITTVPARLSLKLFEFNVTLGITLIEDIETAVQFSGDVFMPPKSQTPLLRLRDTIMCSMIPLEFDCPFPGKKNSSVELLWTCTMHRYITSDFRVNAELADLAGKMIACSNITVTFFN